MNLATLQTPLMILALVGATLFFSALVRRHQEQRARRREAVRRLERGQMGIAEALDHVAEVPLPRALRVALRGEILERYRRIAGLCPDYPGLAGRLEAAGRAMESEGGDLEADVPLLETPEALERVCAGLDELARRMRPGRLLTDPGAARREAWRRLLGERRARCQYRHYTETATRLMDRGDRLQAQNRLRELVHLLRERGPNTESVRELYRLAEDRLEQYARLK